LGVDRICDGGEFLVVQSEIQGSFPFGFVRGKDDDGKRQRRRQPQIPCGDDNKKTSNNKKQATAKKQAIARKQATARSTKLGA